MPTTSTIPSFKDALCDRLRADSDLAGVQVSYGFPWNEELAREAVIVGSSRAENPTGGEFGGGQTSAAVGRRRREERYVLQLDVLVLKPEPQQTVTERAFAIAAAIEESVRSWGEDATPFGGVVRWALVTSLWHDEAGDAETRQAAVHIDISCAERLT